MKEFKTAAAKDANDAEFEEGWRAEPTETTQGNGWDGTGPWRVYHFYNENGERCGGGWALE
jgi:hypothetical protein